MNSNEQKRILIIIITLVVVLFAITVIKKMTSFDETELTEEQKVELQKQQEEKEVIDKLVDMTERERIEYYFSEFLRNIETENYADAYKVLNADFKETYFSTQDDFVKYVNSYFPNEIAIEYNNIERNGNLYVLWIKMTNALTVDKSASGKDMNVIIKEHAVHDFELSFTVNK